MRSNFLNYSHKAIDSPTTSHQSPLPKNHNSHPVRQTHPAQKQDDPPTNFNATENRAIASKHALKVLENTSAT